MNKQFEDWAKGRGVVAHDELTQQRILNLLQQLDQKAICQPEQALQLFNAADALCNAAMWLVVHMTYANNVYLDGRQMIASDFKINPEGHTGGALNMVPAYVGYLLANALTGNTRAWMMGQGHCVAAIDAVNVILGNVDKQQALRYPFNENGLSQLCRNFYSYEFTSEGRTAAPLGSHVGPHTAGGISEGGYLGFAELQYMHMPLPKQELVAFLSDGAFEEQRGSDWAPRWWRGEDTGKVMPIMIANGRRIDQRTTMAQLGGVHWFRKHLTLNGFSPIDINGRDPAAFAWAILTMGDQLQEQYQQVKDGLLSYPVLLPYTIAETEKGYGFPGASTNAAHNLPLTGSPATDDESLMLFNQGCNLLHVPLDKIKQAQKLFNNHQQQQRVQEKDHCLRKLLVSLPKIPSLLEAELQAEIGSLISPMTWVDQWFVHLVNQNAAFRIRIGNPDEMRSNRLNKTLDLLKHRVTAPEANIAEAIDGSVITALNEEAVVSSALANKQGINLVASYEAFAVKMLGAMRQEVIFARHLLESGYEVNWLSVPVIVSSHTWENGKNEQSHQDPTLCEAWLGEMTDVAPVLFPFDALTACAVMAKLYQERGRIATVVVAKGKQLVTVTPAEATKAAATGVYIDSHDKEAKIQLLAIGGYQLQSAKEAAVRLREQGIACSVVAIIEPGRFRQPRDLREKEYVYDDATLQQLIPDVHKRLFISHCRAEVITGVLRRLDTGVNNSHFIGYRNRGGTLDVCGMLYANGQTWAHILQECAVLLGEKPNRYLTEIEIDVFDGNKSPTALWKE